MWYSRSLRGRSSERPCRISFAGLPDDGAGTLSTSRRSRAPRARETSDECVSQMVKVAADVPEGVRAPGSIEGGWEESERGRKLYPAQSRLASRAIISARRKFENAAATWLSLLVTRREGKGAGMTRMRRSGNARALLTARSSLEFLGALISEIELIALKAGWFSSKAVSSASGSVLRHSDLDD